MISYIYFLVFNIIDEIENVLSQISYEACRLQLFRLKYGVDLPNRDFIHIDGAFGKASPYDTEILNEITRCHNEIFWRHHQYRSMVFADNIYK